MKTEAVHIPYRPDVDGLRAIAVLSVVFFHAFPDRLTGGFVGVDIFFVISGYLITNIILKSVARERFSLLDFYARRIRRIFPSLLLVLATCFALAWFSLFPDELQELAKQTLAGTAFFANTLFWMQSGYFDVAAETKPLLHLWSLAVEEQFYLVWPLLLWLLVGGRRRGWLALVLLLLTSFALCIVQGKSNPQGNFYLAFSRAWEFIAGALLASWQISRPAARQNQRRFNDALSVLGALLILLAVQRISPAHTFPGWWTLAPVLGATCIIAAGPHGIVNRTVLAHPLAVAIGLISYPLYLWHWPLLSLARIMQGSTPDQAIRLSAIAASFVLAWLSWRCFERPIRRAQAPVVTRALIGGMLAMAVVSVLAWKFEGFPQRLPSEANLLKNRQWHLNTGNHADCGTSFSKLSASFCRGVSEPSVVLLGDSHAGQLYHGFASLPQESYSRVMVMGAGACAPTLGLDERPGCAELLQSALFRVRSMQQVTTLVLASYYRFAQHSAQPQEHPDQWVAGYLKTIEALRAPGRQLVFVVDNPSLNFDPKTCLRKALMPLNVSAPMQCEASLVLQRSTRATYLAAVDRLRAAAPDVFFFDPATVLCHDNRCPVMIDGLLQYGDFNHLSLYGSQRVVAALVAQLRLVHPNAPRIMPGSDR
jgi:peptidoglycan/LPS O-acetylase OafA/YrhL